MTKKLARSAWGYIVCGATFTALAFCMLGATAFLTAKFTLPEADKSISVVYFGIVVTFLFTVVGLFTLWKLHLLPDVTARNATHDGESSRRKRSA
jgi:hypothetical protein